MNADPVPLAGSRKHKLFSAGWFKSIATAAQFWKWDARDTAVSVIATWFAYAKVSIALFGAKALSEISANFPAAFKAASAAALSTSKVVSAKLVVVAVGVREILLEFIAGI